MSSIPTKQIDGDVAVGRNVSAGGDANIQGNARVGHDMIVEGWLEAKNIKGVNKGLFATVTALREAYPRPHDGWFAGVSASDKDIADLGLTVQQGKALFRMYVGDGGDWVCEPINKLYEIVVDNEQVDNLRADLSTLRGQHESLEKRVDGHDTEISGIKTQQTTLGNSINTNTSNITALKSRVDGHDTAISKNTAAIKAITDSKDQPNGIAPLDANAKVPAANLPGYVDDVVEFNAMVSGITVQRQSSIHKSTDAGCMVVYDQDNDVFVLAVSNVQPSSRVSPRSFMMLLYASNTSVDARASFLFQKKRMSFNGTSGCSRTYSNTVVENERLLCITMRSAIIGVIT